MTEVIDHCWWHVKQISIEKEIYQDKKERKKQQKRNITDLKVSSISPPLFRTDCRRLRRNVKRRRRRGGGSADVSPDGFCCWGVGDCGVAANDDGVVSLNLSKKVLFRFDDVRCMVGADVGDVAVIDSVFGANADGIEIGFVVFCAIRVVWITVVEDVFVEDDDVEGDTDDDAK